MFDHCMKKPKDEALKLIEKVGVKLSAEEKDKEEKQLMKVIIFENDYMHEYVFLKYRRNHEGLEFRENLTKRGCKAPERGVILRISYARMISLT